jgi:ABC-type sugar transport system ATPase subunit
VLQQIGPPQEVYARPANLFVARFIGSPPMNTVTGTVVDGEGAPMVDLPGGRVPLPAGVAAAVRAAGLREIVVGARPEDLRLAAAGRGIAATVVAVEELGHERHVACRLADGQLVILRQAVQEPAPAPDATVHLVADPDALHVFEHGDPGARIG